MITYSHVSNNTNNICRNLSILRFITRLRLRISIVLRATAKINIKLIYMKNHVKHNVWGKIWLDTKINAWRLIFWICSYSSYYTTQKWYHNRHDIFGNLTLYFFKKKKQRQTEYLLYVNYYHDYISVHHMMFCISPWPRYHECKNKRNKIVYNKYYKTVTMWYKFI